MTEKNIKLKGEYSGVGALPTKRTFLFLFLFRATFYFL